MRLIRECPLSQAPHLCVLLTSKHPHFYIASVDLAKIFCDAPMSGLILTQRGVESLTQVSGNGG